METTDRGLLWQVLLLTLERKKAAARGNYPLLDNHNFNGMAPMSMSPFCCQSLQIVLTYSWETDATNTQSILKRLFAKMSSSRAISQSALVRVMLDVRDPIANFAALQAL